MDDLGWQPRIEKHMWWKHNETNALFSFQKILVRGTVAISFVRDKYCLIID